MFAQNDISVTQHTRSLPTLADLAAPKLRGLAQGLGLEHLEVPASELLEVLTCGWLNAPALATPPWPNDITDDGTPFEFSVAFDSGRPKLRLLAEAQGPDLTPTSSWEAGLALNERLKELYGADFSRFDRISELFAPDASSRTRFSLWHAAVLDASGKVDLKVYLNPQIAGASRAWALIDLALLRLEMPQVYRFLDTHIEAEAQPVYLSLDLSRHASARFKIYVAHSNPTAAGIDESLVRAGLIRPGQAAGPIELLSGGAEPSTSRPLLVCYAFSAAQQGAEATVHVPLRSFVENDAEALERACRLLGDERGALLRRGVEAMAGRSLEQGRSLLTYVSFRPREGDPRVTAYLSPELYSIAAPRASSVPPQENEATTTPRHSMIRDLVRTIPASESQGKGTFAAVTDAIRRERERLAQHPFFVRLTRGGSLRDAQIVAERIPFFVMGFQDVLRLVYDTTREPELRELARQHALEDSGHDQWFLHDLERLGVTCDVKRLFSAESSAVRDVIYGQVADVLRSEDDRARLAIVLSLEAAGAEFFERMIGLVERLDRERELRYFARKHQRVEQNHDVFEAESQQRIESIPLLPGSLPELLAVVERTFRGVHTLADDVLRELARGEDVGYEAGSSELEAQDLRQVS